MDTKESDPPLVTLAEEIVESVCIGQIAALAALRAEVAALSTMMSGVPAPAGTAAVSGQPGARAIDLDPDDGDFDNMPV
jgi:hypothetical protein